MTMLRRSNLTVTLSRRLAGRPFAGASRWAAFRTGRLAGPPFARGLSGVFNAIPASSCEAGEDQRVGSPFLAQLNSGGGGVPGVSYTVIETRNDEVVTPWASAFLAGSAVTNITVQNQRWPVPSC